MFPFWMMFLVAAFGVLVPGRLPERQAWVAWFAVAGFFVVLMGMRHEVGGDWFTYELHFQHLSHAAFSEAANFGDPGYYVPGWLMAQMGGDIYWLNTFCALLLMIGTVTFVRRQPMPWLGLLAAVPYMLIVVGMGYTRQSAALGLALLGLAALGDGRVRMFVLWVCLAATFHKTAVLLLPIAAVAGSRNRYWTMAWVLVAFGVMYWAFLEDQSERLWAVYVDYDMQSQGGAIRVLMNAVPAAAFLLLRKRLAPDPVERRLWIWISLLAIACVPLVFVSSTAVDRMGLYLIPVQMFVACRMSRLAKTPQGRTVIVLGLVGYFTVVQIVWLNFATHAKYWVPYNFMPLG
ncbi:EpsG family protein [Luteimonas sp. MC1825]|uniref:EpsG family protein n=1 Tax=Luteimonas sp. MC1825 TaxID=2761107 RepID=UPI00160E8D2C|nr:EpsG family protein [Luteimonas sp. MC1825]MBB6599053.1 EpsG family protein [Luteimonas sp. MC1825]QOC89186.1 EpsG family protein [Luteimonas sp. MC1825]